MPIEDIFPGLRGTSYTITSPHSETYNCIAWAAERNDTWWWPDPWKCGYWPPGAPREETISAFVRAFETCGFSICDHGQHEPGYIKLALYAIGETPTHAARQLPGGMWTSKLGKSVDLEHTIDALCGVEYGTVVCYMRRGQPAG